jgi:hypothetical protein
MRFTSALLVLAALMIPLSAAGQTQAAEAKAQQDWHEIVDRMAGAWKMTGNVMGNAAHHDVRAEWVFNRQFLRIEERTSADAPAAEKHYDAVWFLGYDDVSDRYVLHLMDTFGGRFSETLGYGVRDGDAIRFVFEYPDGPFHTTMTCDPAKSTWNWRMEQKNKAGGWTPFADLTLTTSPQ